MPVPLSEFVTPTQCARMLKTHVSTIYRLILHGKIPARRIGGRRYVIRRDDMIRFCEGEVVIPVARVEWSRHDADG